MCSAGSALRRQDLFTQRSVTARQASHPPICVHMSCLHRAVPVCHRRHLRDTHHAEGLVVQGGHQAGVVPALNLHTAVGPRHRAVGGAAAGKWRRLLHCHHTSFTARCRG